MTHAIIQWKGMRLRREDGSNRRKRAARTVPRPLTRSRLLTGCLLLLTAAALQLAPTVPASATAVPECAAGGVKVKATPRPATINVTDTRTNTKVSVRVTITGTTFTITPTDANVTLDTASWCLKASTSTQNGTATSGASTIKNKQGIPQAISYLVVYTVTTGPIDPVGSCWDGEDGLNDYAYTGPVNTLNNAYQTASQDGTCTGGAILLHTVVQAPDQSAAQALCLSLAGLANATRLQNVFGGDPPTGFPAAPADYWSCF